MNALFDVSQIQIGWRDILDVALVTFLLYRLILFVKGTRAVSVVYGLVLIILVYFVSEEFGLYTLNWLLANFLGSLFLVVVIIFQQDIRKALSEVGAGRMFRSGNHQIGEPALNELIQALVSLAASRIGALVVLEKSVPLGDVVEKGVRLNAKVSKDLLVTIFYPNTPLHDGAVIMKGSEIVAAACILPLSSSGAGHRSDLGTRHRAALGMSEETDAVVVVVSEERGRISVSHEGTLTVCPDESRLREILLEKLAR